MKEFMDVAIDLLGVLVAVFIFDLMIYKKNNS